MNLLADGDLNQRKTLLSVLGVPMYLVNVEDTRFYFDSMNTQFVDLLGLQSPLEQIPLNVDALREITHTEVEAEFYFERLEANLAACLRTAKTFRREELTRRFDDTNFWSRVSFEPIRKHGRIIRILVTVIDITEMMDALNNVEQALSSLLREHVDICAICHKVKGVADNWMSIGDYREERSDITFSHGMCPQCYRKQKSDAR